MSGRPLGLVLATGPPADPLGGGPGVRGRLSREQDDLPPRLFRKWWPVVTCVSAWTVGLAAVARDLWIDSEVSAGAMPAYAALFAIGAAGSALGRRGGG